MKVFYIQPIPWANLIVIPNKAQASRNLAVEARYVPITRRVWITVIVGRFMNDAVLNACIDAATRVVRVAWMMRQLGILTENIALLALRLTSFWNMLLTTFESDPSALSEDGK